MTNQYPITVLKYFKLIMMKTFVVILNSALVGLEMAVCQIRTLEFIQAQYRNFFSQK